ncbi:MAG: hypothetical protein ACYCXG_05450 [Acidiferrobacter sp.]
MTDAYVPIACAVHDRYERALITGAPLVAHWTIGGRPHHGRIWVLAIETQHSEEFVVFRDTNDTRHRVRLDHVRLQAAPS